MIVVAIAATKMRVRSPFGHINGHTTITAGHCLHLLTNKSLSIGNDRARASWASTPNNNLPASPFFSIVSFIFSSPETG